MRKYVIADISEEASFDYNQLVDIDSSYSRKSLDGSKVLARYEGSAPAFLAGKPAHSHAEILEILSGSEWTAPMEEL